MRTVRAAYLNSDCAILLRSRQDGRFRPFDQVMISRRKTSKAVIMRTIIDGTGIPVDPVT